MISLSIEHKLIFKKIYNLLKNHKTDEFHQLIDKTKKKLKTNPEFYGLVGLLSFFQAEEYFFACMYDKAIEKINTALKYDNQYYYLLYQIIIFEKTNQEFKTIPLYEELLARDEERQNLPEVIYYFALSNLATCWYHIVEIPDWHQQKYGKKINFAYAQEHYQKILDAPLWLKDKYSFLISNAQNGIGNTYAQNNNTEEAGNYFLKALEFKDKLKENYPEIIINSLNGLAWCKFKEKHFYLATKNYTKCSRIALSVFGEEHKVSVKLHKCLSLSWKERMGFEETGFNNIKLLYGGVEKNSKKVRVVGSRSSYYYNPKALKVNNVPVSNEKSEDVKKIDMSLNIAKEVSQKYFPINILVNYLNLPISQSIGLNKNSVIKTSLHMPNNNNEISDSKKLDVDDSERRLFSII